MGSKKETAKLVATMQDFSRPSLLRIPKKLPTLNYRFVRNLPDEISMKEAIGYRVADGEIVRQSGLKPSVDGTYRVGDLILMVEDYSHHRDHKIAEGELKKRQAEMMKSGVKRPTRRGEWGFEESIKSQ